MAKVKTVKVRKDHVCSICKQTIKKGDMARKHEDRVPVGSDDEWGFSQDGIRYIREYRHDDLTQCHFSSDDIQDFMFF